MPGQKSSTGQMPKQPKRYGFSTLSSGEELVVKVDSKREELNARKAAHNLNSRTDKQFTTRLDQDALVVTRVK